MHAHTDAHAQAHTCAHIRTHARTHTRTHARIHTRTRTHARTTHLCHTSPGPEYSCVGIAQYIHIRTHIKRMHTYLNILVWVASRHTLGHNMRIYIYLYIHTYMYTYLQVLTWVFFHEISKFGHNTAHHRAPYTHNLYVHTCVHLNILEHSYAGMSLQKEHSSPQGPTHTLYIHIYAYKYTCIYLNILAWVFSRHNSEHNMARHTAALQNAHSKTHR